MALNVTTAVFRPGFNIATASPSLVQWDQGQTLQFEGVELPSAYQVEFTNAVTVQAIPRIGGPDGVEIPNELLQQSYPITAYIVLHETAEDRETEYWATIYVKARQQPREETPDPEQISVIDQTIAALQDGVADAQAAANEAEAASQAVQDMGVEAETLPAGSAATVEKTVDPETGVVTLTYGIPKGTKGDKGDKGNTGETYMLAPSVDTIVKNPNTGTFIPAQIIFTVYKVVNGTSSPYRAAAIVADIFGMGMVPHYEVVNDYRLTVPINSIADTGYVACSAYGNGGIIATITIPCILDGAKGDPGEGVAPGGTTGQFLKKKSGTDYDTEWADVDPGVTSVNWKTGAVTLTASDVGAKPASYEAPVSSVNGKTGAVVLDAGDIGYDGEATYPDASVGKELGTINSALSSIASVTEIIDTASGAIASFPDGSGLPMRSLLAQINPVQDLHGYDAPWPAGGGKNKYNAAVQTIPSTDATVTISGETISASWTGGYLFITGKNAQSFPAGTYTITAYGTNVSYLRAWMYTVADNTETNIGAFNTGATFTATEEFYIGISGVSAGIGSTVVFTVQLETGSTSTSWTPYANICPISGWTGLSGQRTGKNLFDPSVLLEGTGWTESDGVYTGYSSTLFTAFQNGIPFTFKFKENTSYTLSVKSSQSDGDIGGARFIIHYTDNSSSTALSFDSNGGEVSVTSNANKTIARITFNYGSGKLFSLWNVMLCEQSTASTYEPYTGEAISVTFPTTVYGGSDEVIGGNGTSTMGMVDLGTLDWTLAYDRFNAQLPNIKPSSGQSNKPNILCSSYPTITPNEWYAKTLGITSLINGYIGDGYVGLIDPAYSDAASLKTALSGVMLCYELATPQTFTHTGQPVDTLVGQNNIWVDTGDVSVTYQASIKGYIDKVLGA